MSKLKLTATSEPILKAHESGNMLIWSEQMEKYMEKCINNENYEIIVEVSKKYKFRICYEVGYLERMDYKIKVNSIDDGIVEMIGFISCDYKTINELKKDFYNEYNNGKIIKNLKIYRTLR